MDGSAGSGRTPFEQSAATLPGVSAPSSVVRSIVRIASSSAQTFASRLIERCESDALARHGLRIDELDALLDFGCGCGRVTRNWAHLDGPAVAGSDHDEAAVQWCRRSLPFARFEVNGLGPPLAFADERFELVYGLSGFTHLTE